MQYHKQQGMKNHEYEVSVRTSWKNLTGKLPRVPVLPQFSLGRLGVQKGQTTTGSLSDPTSKMDELNGSAYCLWSDKPFASQQEAVR